VSLLTKKSLDVQNTSVGRSPAGNKVAKISKASIKTLPNEIITQIISYLVDDYVRKREIAAVCKAWRGIVLGTPMFWRRILLSPQNTNADSLRFLKRALELSGSATLDVEFCYSALPEQQRILDLHLMELIHAGIHRWRSLILTAVWVQTTTSTPISAVLKGSFHSLRSLTLLGVSRFEGGNDLLEPFYALIANTAPSLYEFGCTGIKPPAILRNARIFRELKSLTCSFDVATLIKPQFDVDKLNLINNNPHQSYPHFILPLWVQFDWLNLSNLSDCGLQIVQELEINRVVLDVQPKRLNFPSLRTLKISCDINLRWILDTAAPELYQLTIVGSVTGRRNVPDIEFVFQTENHRVQIAPKHLELRLYLHPSDTLIILNQWPQIQHLTLHWLSTSEWTNNFARKLSKEKDPLCPDLLVLRIFMGGWRDESMSEWIDTAKEVLRGRKDIFPLWKIEMFGSGFHGGRKHVVTIFDL
jgi:hypothetical protein